MERIQDTIKALRDDDETPREHVAEKYYEIRNLIRDELRDQLSECRRLTKSASQAYLAMRKRRFPTMVENATRNETLDIVCDHDTWLEFRRVIRRGFREYTYKFWYDRSRPSNRNYVKLKLGSQKLLGIAKELASKILTPGSWEVYTVTGTYQDEEAIRVRIE